MPPIVAIVAPGMMGSAVAHRLTASGVEVRTSLAGRSADTVTRARAAGMIDANDTELAEADFILSIVPPGMAVALAERLAPALRAARKKPVYVDCNAVSPDTVLRIDRLIRETGAAFVDGGIIGPPPEIQFDQDTDLSLGPGCGEGCCPAAIWPVDASPAGPGRCRLGYEDVLRGHYQRVHRSRCGHYACGNPSRNRGCACGGDESQSARATEVADNANAKNAQ